MSRSRLFGQFFRVLRWKNCSVRRRGGGNVKIGFIDFQGLVGRAENSPIVFRPFHETGISTACFRGALCRQLFQRSVEVYLIRRLCLQTGVRAAIVEELDVVADPVSGFADRVVSMQIDLFVFD